MSSLRLALKKSREDIKQDGKVPAPGKKTEPVNKPVESDHDEQEWAETPRKRGRPRKHPSSGEGPDAGSENESSAGGESDASESDNKKLSGHEAAHRIQKQWKKHEQEGHQEQAVQSSAEKLEYAEQSNPAPEIETRTRVAEGPASDSLQDAIPSASERIKAHDSNPTSTLLSGDSAAKEDDAIRVPKPKPRTVPPPSQHLASWQTNHIAPKRARKSLATGLRVKVRFAMRKDGGKKKKKWFGGCITGVSKEGSKVRIKYDDGTSEVTKFPDKDIVVDDTDNGKHEVAEGVAEKFLPREPDPKEAERSKHESSNDPLSRRTLESKSLANVQPVRETQLDPAVQGESTKEVERGRTPQGGNANADTQRNEGSSGSDGPSSSALAASEPKQVELLQKVEGRQAAYPTSNKLTDEVAEISSAPHKSQVSVQGSTESILHTSGAVSTSSLRAESPKEQSVSLGFDDGTNEQPKKRKRGRPPKQRPIVDSSDAKGAGEATDQMVTERGPSPERHNDAQQRGGLTIRIPLVMQQEKGTTRSPLVSKPTVQPVSAGSELNGHSPKAKRKRVEGVVDGTTEEKSASKRIHIDVASNKVSTGDEQGARSEVAPRSPTSMVKVRKKRNRKHGEGSSATGQNETVDTPFEFPAVPSLDRLGDDNGRKHIPSNDGLEHPSQAEFEGNGNDSTPARLRTKPHSSDNAPSVRSGRRAAQEANERIVAKQESSENLPKLKKKRRREGDEHKVLLHKQQLSVLEEDSQWVQCDACKKWRVIPSSVVDTLPKQWYCENNTYDPKRASCDAPEQTAKQVAKERKRAKKRKLRLMEAGAGADSSEGKADRQERSRSPRPPDDDEDGGRPKRISPTEVSSAQVDAFGKTERRGGPPSSRRGRSSDIPPDGSQSVVQERRGRGRPRRIPAGVPKESSISSSKNAGDEADNLEWVQCEKCDKWRKLPPHISADELPDVWYCSMNTWSATLTCEDPEDKADGLQDVGLFGSSGSAGKLTYRNLIFGSTGRKANRPISERTRAAESLFGTIAEDEDAPPAVMYTNCSAFVSRSKSSHASDENRKPLLFDVMKKSHLWSELRADFHVSKHSSKGVASSSFFLGRTYESLSSKAKEELKSFLVDILGSRTLSGEDIMAEVESDDMGTGYGVVRSSCTINVIVTTLCTLVREGILEMVCPRKYGPSSIKTEWNPRYRKVDRHRCTEEKRKLSRCMKISKPWKATDTDSCTSSK